MATREATTIKVADITTREGDTMVDIVIKEVDKGTMTEVIITVSSKVFVMIQ